VKRRNLVLAQMVRTKLIAPKEEAAGRKTKLRLTPPEQEGGAPWFVAAIRRELHDRFGADAETKGLRVRTTLDAGLQPSRRRSWSARSRRSNPASWGRSPPRNATERL